MKKHLYNYKINVLDSNIIDGDTLKNIFVDLGFYTYKRIKIRLNRIDTPELRTKDKKEKAKGLKSKEYLKSLLVGYDDITVTVIGKDKYGRWLGELYKGKTNLNDIMVSTNHAKWY